MKTFRYGLTMVAGWLLASETLAVVIDDFSAGPAVSTPSGVGTDWEELRTVQTGLPTDSVLGGERDSFFLLQGNTEIDTDEGELRIDHDGEFFEVGILRYAGPTPLPQLNADLTAGGTDHFLVRFTTSRYFGAPTNPNRLRLLLRSGEGTLDAESRFETVVLPDTDGPFTVALPLAEPGSGFDPTDVDLIDLSFFLYESPIVLAIDEIVTGRLVEGDFNADGVVDAADAQTFGSLYGVTGDGLAADANGDGVVDAADYTVWRDATSAAAVAVPEPIGAVLLLTLAGGLLSRRS